MIRATFETLQVAELDPENPVERWAVILPYGPILAYTTTKREAVVVAKAIQHAIADVAPLSLEKGEGQ